MKGAQYKGYFIRYDPLPMPSNRVDWEWWHDDYDGAPDAHDHRCGRERSMDACKDAIDDCIAYLEDPLPGDQCCAKCGDRTDGGSPCSGNRYRPCEARFCRTCADPFGLYCESCSESL